MIRRKQKELLLQVLNLNKLPNTKDKVEWKVLFYDERGFEILTTVMKLSELIEHGVTFHANLSKKRDPIPGVSAIYFVEETKETLDRIAEDCNRRLYSSVYVNFISSVSKNGITTLARKIGSSSELICGVYDQYINFSSLNQHLFTLQERDNYISSIYGFHVNEESAAGTLSDIGRRLVDVFAAVGDNPFILYKSDSEVSKRVVASFTEKMSTIDPQFLKTRKSDSSKPPLLLILDRTADFVAMLHHSDCYGALIHDQYGISRGEVSINDKTYELDCDKDPFWNDNAIRPFGDVVRVNQEAMLKFKQKYGELDENLGSAITSLPELQSRQKYLATHTQIGAEIVNAVKRKRVNSMYQLESDMISGSGVSIDQLIECASQIPDETDKERLFTIAYLCNVISDQDLPRVSAASNCQLDFLQSLGIFKLRKKSGLLTRVMAEGQDPCAILPVPAAVKAVISGNLDGFCDKDGKTPKRLGEHGFVCVFVIGPGSYPEFKGVVSLSHNICYGCTSLIRPSDIMSQLQTMNQ